MGELKGKLERIVELKATPEAFFNVWKSEAHQIPNHTPSHIHSVDIHDGDWETSGSIKIWKYHHDGKTEVIKEKVEIDEEKMMIKLVAVEGDVMKYYKVYNPIYYLAPKDGGCVATCILEYEKLDHTMPTPDKYMDFMVSLTKGIDDGLCQAK
ncbi:Polyketide cyclase/dehydrase and lipid transport superfamily protein [Euphorbia peplus]|nr:Polyketide cyclase/dehydrase and lipid transport superfamily protein [Euphorbia peplus]